MTSRYIRHALCEQFKRESDFEVCGEAENGKEAIAKARELHPDLIVLDLSMPVMNGLDAARELKRLMPDVPIIMFTSYCDSSTEQQIRLVGISEVVSKSQPAVGQQSPKPALSHRCVITSFPSRENPSPSPLMSQSL
jgi:two-component system, NarL family, vancomycin resistance associated response regulator VraR